MNEFFRQVVDDARRLWEQMSAAQRVLVVGVVVAVLGLLAGLVLWAQQPAYVTLYTNDLKTAEAELTKALAMAGNQSDPFMTCLLAMTVEKLGQAAKAKELYEKAYGLATAHNPPAAFVRPLARKKLGL